MKTEYKIAIQKNKNQESTIKGIKYLKNILINIKKKLYNLYIRYVIKL